mmetsp:Transcript_14174/g.21215  ORF Transcript_14174/g.21215 Transcript_14174/m.21215 type:complete len:214 (+) Transcript_14174:185-826(+)
MDMSQMVYVRGVKTSSAVQRVSVWPLRVRVSACKCLPVRMSPIRGTAPVLLNYSAALIVATTQMWNLETVHTTTITGVTLRPMLYLIWMTNTALRSFLLCTTESGHAQWCMMTHSWKGSRQTLILVLLMLTLIYCRLLLVKKKQIFASLLPVGLIALSTTSISATGRIVQVFRSRLGHPLRYSPWLMLEVTSGSNVLMLALTPPPQETTVRLH